MADFSVEIKFGGKYCVIPDAGRFPSLAKKANLFLCPLGRTPGKGRLLMLRANVDSLLAESSPYHDLVFRQVGDAETLTLKNLLIVRADRVFKGGEDDPDSLYLVEIADKRRLVADFSDTGQMQGNMRSWAGAVTYLVDYDATTWSDFAYGFWSRMSDILGSFPGLPYSPDGVPENIQFFGQNAWECLNRLLLKIGCAVRYDPTSDAFTIIRLSTAQSDLPADFETRVTEFNAEPLESNAVDYPAIIRVYFPNYLPYGQENDTAAEDNWATEEVLTFVNVPSGIAGAVAGTVLPLWDDLPQVKNESHVITNSAELDSRAAERASNWINSNLVCGGRTRKVFPGIHADILPGSQIKAVLWRFWGSDAGGTATEIVNHQYTAKSISLGGSIGDCIEWDLSSGRDENFSPVDLARRTYPNYPKIENAVQVWQSSGDAGDEVSPTSGVYPGRVRRFVAAAMAEKEDCWLFFPAIQFPTESKQAISPPRKGDYHMGRLSGIYTAGGYTRPLYVVCPTGPGEKIKWGKAKYNWHKAGVGFASPYVVINPCDSADGDNVDTGTEVTVLLPRRGIVSGVYETGTPNVIANQVIAYSTTSKANGEAVGEYVCVSTYMDAVLGTVVLRALPEGFDGPESGWAKMDGDENKLPYGSGIDMTNMFVREGGPSDEPLGTEVHTHEGRAEPAATNISIFAHQQHQHPLSVGNTFPTGVTPGTSGLRIDSDCTGNAMIGGCDDPATFGHTVEDETHYHALGIDTAPHLPPHKKLLFYERVDNSSA